MQNNGLLAQLVNWSVLATMEGVVYHEVIGHLNSLHTAATVFAMTFIFY